MSMGMMSNPSGPNDFWIVAENQMTTIPHLVLGLEEGSLTRYYVAKSPKPKNP